MRNGPAHSQRRVTTLARRHPIPDRPLKSGGTWKRAPGSGKCPAIERHDLGQEGLERAHLAPELHPAPLRVHVEVVAVVGQHPEGRPREADRLAAEAQPGQLLDGLH